MNLKTIKNIDVDLWTDLLGHSSQASPFQSPEFYKFINKIPGFKPEVFAIEDGGKLLALVIVVIQKEKGIMAYFSRRGIVYGGPLIRKNNVNALGVLLEHTSAALRGKVIYIESRNFFDYQAFISIFNVQKWNFLPYLNFQVSAAGKTKDDLLAAMKYNRRREIKMSIKHGATYDLASNEEEVAEVYKILKSLYRERVNLPLPNFEFFSSFIKSEFTRVFVVKIDDKVIAGSFCLFYPGKNLYTMYYCGLREIDKKIFPTNLAVWAAIEYAVNEQIPVVDLMGAGRPDEDYGVRKYKSQFGGDLVEYGRFLKVLNPFLYNLGRLGLKMMTKFNS